MSFLFTHPPRIVLRVGISASLAVVLAIPSVARAHSGVEGGSPLRFYAFWRDVPHLDRAARLVVHLGGAYPDSALGRATIHLPLGVELIEGDTAIAGYPARETEYVLSLRNAFPGKRTIRGEVFVDWGRQVVDEGEVELEYTVGDSASRKKLSKPTRMELVRGESRFRYGSTYLVPIDSSERVLQGELDAIGRARILRRSPVADSLGLVEAGDSIGCIVFVRKDGSVRDVRIIDKHQKHAELKNLVQRALERDWLFIPIQWQGRSMDSWVFVRIPITMSPGARPR